MKNEQQQQARNLYFQTELSKTQIANLLNISRTSLHYWVKEGDWDRLKMCSMHMPSLLAENCYHIMGHLTKYMLSERRLTNPCSRQEAETLHKLVLTVNKLKNRSTLNENMEMFAFFLDGLSKTEPDLAEKIKPHVEEYISSRSSVHAHHLMPGNFNNMGYLPTPETDDKEQQLDAQDFYEWDKQKDDADRLSQPVNDAALDNNKTSVMIEDNMNSVLPEKTELLGEPVEDDPVQKAQQVIDSLLTNEAVEKAIREQENPEFYMEKLDAAKRAQQKAIMEKAEKTIKQYMEKNKNLGGDEGVNKAAA